VTEPAFSVGLLSAGQDRSQFQSGAQALDHYFKQQVGQDVRRRITSCFVATNPGGQVAGFYTLASASIPMNDLPPAMLKKLPRYPQVPVVRMGRLAVDLAFKGQGLGAALLADALQRCCKADIAAFALVVDAKDQHAAAFYAHHGFLALSDQPLCLFLPLATARSLLA
jgi:ribosomal protein S18 acetylase RimI-like enzyme